LLLFLPNVAWLTGCLAKDGRVPARVKVLLGVAAAYFVSPVDFIPDWIPLLGLLDDLLVAMIVLDIIFNQVDDDVVRSYWRGSAGALDAGRKISRICTFFIPKRLKERVISGRRKQQRAAGSS